MAFCDTHNWRMKLILDKMSDSFEMLELILVIDSGSGKIKGTVEDSKHKVMSELAGQCSAMKRTGLPPEALMSFIFHVTKGGIKRGLHLSGVAFNEPGKTAPSFEGRFILFTPDQQTPPVPNLATGQLQTIPLGDTGDTGTGSGSQT